MQNRKLLLLFIVFCSLSLMRLNAQKSLSVDEISGANSLFTLTEITKLTFSDGNLIIAKEGESSSTFAIQDLSKLSFETSTNVQRLQTQTASRLWPNPVKDHFFIARNNDEGSDFVVEVIDLQGKVLLNCINNSNASIDVSELRKGIYICRVYNQNEIENIKFIKY